MRRFYCHISKAFLKYNKKISYSLDQVKLRFETFENSVIIFCFIASDWLIWIEAIFADVDGFCATWFDETGIGVSLWVFFRKWF